MSKDLQEDEIKFSIATIIKNASIAGVVTTSLTPFYNFTNCLMAKKSFVMKRMWYGGSIYFIEAFPSYAISYGINNWMQSYFEPTFENQLFCSIIAGISASTFTNPFGVFTALKQLDQLTPRETWHKVIKARGYTGLYSGGLAGALQSALWVPSFHIVPEYLGNRLQQQYAIPNSSANLIGAGLSGALFGGIITPLTSFRLKRQRMATSESRLPSYLQCFKQALKTPLPPQSKLFGFFKPALARSLTCSTTIFSLELAHQGFERLMKK